MAGELWDRQAGEPGEAFLAFEAFRKMSAPRRGLPEGFDVSKCRGWHREWLWDLRVEAWDEHLTALARSEEQALVTQTAKDRALDWMRTFSLGKRVGLRELRRLVERSEDGTTLRPNELVKLLEFLWKAERVMDGEPTERTETTNVDLTGLSDDEQAKIAELLAKAEIH